MPVSWILNSKAVQSFPELLLLLPASPPSHSALLSATVLNSFGERGLALAWTRKVNGLFARNMPSILKRKFSYKAFNIFFSCSFQQGNFFSIPNTELEQFGSSQCAVLAPKAAGPFLAKPLQLLPTRFLSQGCSDDFGGL